jgi:type IV pilus assembly protein PilY1
MDGKALISSLAISPAVSRNISPAVALFIALAAATAHAQVVSEDFTAGTTKNDWYFFNGACLTASIASSVSPGNVPGCTSPSIKAYYNENLVGGANGTKDGGQTLPDPTNNGALRFTNGRLNSKSTNGGKNQNGAIVSKDPFPTGQGVQITFKTVTYRGDSGGEGKNGADGISFYLMDAAKDAGIGSWGGSLGYSCSNTNPPYDGLVGAYIGLGVDEYGNFLNGTSNMVDYKGPNPARGDNTAFGYGYKPNRIGLRGAGNISWAWLNSTHPEYYPGSMTDEQKRAAVQKTCSTGKLWDYSKSNSAPTRIDNPSIRNYAPIPNAYKELPSNLLIANEYADGGYSRRDATPIVYNLKITQDGLLSFSYSYNGGNWQSVISKQSITASNGPLPANFRFGFAGATGGASNIHEILCFKAQPLDLSSSSTGVNEKQSAKVESGTQAYFAFYDPNDWTGRLTAHDLLVDESNNLIVKNAANWDASCVLTGVPTGKTCPTTDVAGATAAQDPTARTVLTWGLNGTTPGGVPFKWDRLTSGQKAALTDGDATPTENRLNYLRGDRTNEVNTAGAGLFRARNSVLGDIVNSSPTWVGPPQLPYTAPWKDRLYPSRTAAETSGKSYADFTAEAQLRTNVVYVGSNDGMLHGFRAGGFDKSGNYTTVNAANDGKELLAYMPSSVLNTIRNSSDASLDFANTQYGHQFFVDATPGTGDLFYDGNWHTWLVGGLGSGGAGIFALDVTDPSAANFDESNAAKLVIGEWGPGSLECAYVADCDKSMGQSYGVPLIRRLHNGKWAVIFGNGFNSQTGDAGIYIMTVEPTNGARTFYYLSTKTGTAANKNGIAYASTADLDGDHITDYIYAGDLFGNIWRFDLTSFTASSWAVGAAPLFTTPNAQPITTRLVIASGPTSLGANQLMIGFGTGKKSPFTNTNPVGYVSGTQSLYGVWDWNMTAWNSKSGAKYASLAEDKTGPTLSPPYTVKQTNLQKQDIVLNGENRDIATNAIVCWKSAAGCGPNNDKFGWYLDLPGTGEQIVFNPQLLGSAFVVNSVVPATNSILSCTTNTDTGYTYAMSIMSGGAFKNFFPRYSDEKAVGVRTDATGTSFPVVTADGSTWLVYQTVKDEHETEKINLPPNTKANRLTWIELR